MRASNDENVSVAAKVKLLLPILYRIEVNMEPTKRWLEKFQTAVQFVEQILFVAFPQYL
jgi:hypothetical protein